MATLLSQISPFVQDELNNRKLIISANAPVSQELLWMQTRTPWIKMQSNAVLTNENDNKLLGEGLGTLYSSWLNVGKSAQFDGMYQTTALRPNPGITGLSSTIKGHLGVMREVNVKFKVYTLQQLELYQDLYMIPGIGVLVEWGWSVAYERDASGKISTATIPSLTLINEDEDSSDNRWLKETIRKKVEQGKGSYDALFGLISNFSIAFVEDGTWDCETTIVGPGAMTVDINLQSPSNALDEKLVSYFENEINKTIQGNTEARFCGVAAFKGIKPDIEIPLTPEEQQKKAVQDANDAAARKEAREKGPAVIPGLKPGASPPISTVPEDKKKTPPTAEFIFKEPNERVKNLDAEAVALANAINRRLVERTGNRLTVTSFYRTKEENDELVKKGLAEPDSLHMQGKAFDIRVAEWNAACPTIEEKLGVLGSYGKPSGYEYIVHGDPLHVHIEPKTDKSTSKPAKDDSKQGTDHTPPTERRGKTSQASFELNKTNVYVTWEFIENTLNGFFGDVQWSGLNYAGKNLINSFVKKDVKPNEQPPLAIIPCTDFTGGNGFLWRSFTPTNMLIPNRPPKFNPSAELINNANVDLRPFRTVEQFGDLGSVWINYNIVVKPALKRNETVYSALNDIINKMNDASGGLWSLTVLYDNTGYSTYRIVDMKCPHDTPIGEYTFNLNSRESIIRSATINMVIPDAMKSAAMIASNAPEDVDIESSIADRDIVGIFRSLSRGVRDRFAIKREQINKPRKNETPAEKIEREKQIESEKNRQTAVAKLVAGGLGVGWNEEMTGEQKGAVINRMFAYIEKSTQKFSAIIPLDLTIVLDGIAGFTWGNVFNVSYLPSKYRTNAMFQVRDISHEVNEDGWTTTIIGLMRPKYNGTEVAQPNMVQLVNLSEPEVKSYEQSVVATTDNTRVTGYAWSDEISTVENPTP